MRPVREDVRGFTWRVASINTNETTVARMKIKVLTVYRLWWLHDVKALVQEQIRWNR